VQFAKDGQKAFVITDDGVCILDLATLTDGAIVAPVPVSPFPLEKPPEREVLTTPDAQWALVRQTGLTGLYAVHLPSKQIVQVELGSVPTDLDLLPDGSAALAVLRDAKAVALVALPKDVTASLATEIISVNLTAGLARLTEDGKTALLYTSVAGIEEVAALDLVSRKVVAVPLRKTVEFVFLPPGSRKALLMHKPAPGPNGQDAVEAKVDQSEGYTLYDLDTGYTKLVLTPVRPTGIAASALGGKTKVWLLLPDPAGLEHGVQTADLLSFQTATVQLGSKPEFVRFLPQAGVMAITQVHPSGRITFVHAGTGEAKTVTGFELNGKVK